SQRGPRIYRPRHRHVVPTARMAERNSAARLPVCRTFVFVVSAFCLGAEGAINDNTFSLFVVSLPAVLIGTWLGKRVRDQIDEAEIRKVVLILVMASGFALTLARS